MTPLTRHLSVTTSLICVVVLAATNCSEKQPTPPSLPALVPANLVAVSATDVTGIVGTAVADAPAVRVTDKNGSPVAGVTVTFVAGQEAGTLAASEVRTDSDGVARSGSWILGKLAIRHVVTAQSTALPGKSATFSSMGVARGLKSISRYAGDRQIAEVGTSIRFPLTVFASDTFGNPIAGIPVSFAVVSGGGTIDQTPVTTNAGGVSSSSLLKLGALVGDQHVEASAIGIRTSFTLSARQPACLVINCSDNRLAFVRDGDIYTASADGSNTIRLTKGIEPAWSADGRIAFTGVDGVYVMNEDGSNIRLVAPGGSSPAWSPDAQRIAVGTRIDGIRIVTVDAPTASTVRLGLSAAFTNWPTWSPDGSRVAFAENAYDLGLDVFVAHRDGSHLEVLTNRSVAALAFGPGYTPYSQPAWSPDGKTMALMQCKPDAWFNCEDGYVVVMNADGTRIVRLAATHGYVRPSWSPNGKWITFDGPSGILFVSADGLQQGILIPNARNAAWRP